MASAFRRGGRRRRKTGAEPPRKKRTGRRGGTKYEGRDHGLTQTFGERLRVIRKRRGMTQADLARALGVTVQTIVRYESLRLEEVRPARLAAIAAALGVEERELTGEAGEDEALSMLTRGLKNMDPEQRENLIRVMMPFVMQYQKEPEEAPHGKDSLS